MEVKWTPSPNYSPGRKGKEIIAIVNHITAGLMPGTLNWLRNPNAKASAHYLVTKSGIIYQLVKDEDTAFHAGIVNKPDWPLYDGSNPNFYSIGIEHEALAGEHLSEAQYQATLWLHRQLVQRWGIAVDRNHIIGHYRIDSSNRKNDPGPGFPWERLFTDLLIPPKENVSNIQIQLIKTLPGILVDGQSYAAVRELAEGLGRTVEWDAGLRVVFIPPVTIKVTPGDPDSVRIVTGKQVIPGLMVGDRVYAPVRQLVETLGHKVLWDQKNRRVIVE